ncbi:2-phosphosulfolactate phosphatase [Castellaniella sp.]|uniref:2-phosphosulfolactate phosphatase n=1 Tax=Castellaniella sp. TaxID=1955812 RepID=UPI00355FD376
MKKVFVVPTKDGLQTDRGPDSAVIVLDIIFATTSITAALQAGVERIIPALHFDDAVRLHRESGAGDSVIAGELNAEPFPGGLPFDPLALAQADLAGKTLIYATTNGTVALRQAQGFRLTCAASLLNTMAVVRHLLARSDEYSDIVIVCAGSRGRFSLEDFFGAGYVVQCLRQAARGPLTFSDAALAAEMCFANAQPVQALEGSRVGRLMVGRGLADSVAYTGRLDCSDVIPVFHGGSIRDQSRVFEGGA